MSNSASTTSAQRPVRTAIYLRISQDREMDGLAIERQREDCEREARYRRWEVVETYVDQSKSATDKTKVRPAYDQMVADWEAGRFDAIVCWDLDRLTRQPRQLEDWIDAAEDRGLKLVTASGDLDLTDDRGRTFARVVLAFAKGEVDRKSARQRRAQMQRAAQGRPPKGVRPLGYSVDGEVRKREAKAVQAIYEAFHGGASLRGIARALSGIVEADADKAQQVKGVPKIQRHTRTLAIERNRRRETEGLPPKEVPEDSPWPESTVLGILRNPRYAGYSVYTDVRDRRNAVTANAKKKAVLEAQKGEPVLAVRGKRREWREFIVKDEDGQPVKGQWEPLVSVELWEGVQAILDSEERVTNRVGTHRRHLGSGLYLCGLCDEPVRGATRGYRCKHGHINRTGPDIDNFVRKAVAKRLAKPDALSSVPATDSPRLAGLLAEIDEQRAKIKRAERDYDDGFLEAADLKRNRERANEAITRLEAEVRSLPRGAVNVPVLAAEDPARAFLDGDLNTQRATIETLVTVRLFPMPRGCKVNRVVKGEKEVNPAFYESVHIDWNGETASTEPSDDARAHQVDRASEGSPSPDDASCLPDAPDSVVPLTNEGEG